MIILIGQRRVGKSFVLRMTRDWLKENIKDANVIYINKEYENDNEIRTSKELYRYATDRLPENGRNYLLIDEVQDIENFENALRSLHAENRCQIIATGSNAHVFSSELSNRLGGRYVEVPIYTLSYTEFLKFHRMEDSENSLHEYLRVGGLPALSHFDIRNSSEVRDYLLGVYNTVMLQDVISREQIRNVRFIKNLCVYTAHNIGKLFSIRNIGNVMKANGENVTTLLTSNYLEYLRNSFLIKEVARYDIHGKKLFESICKYYFSDHGLRNLLSGFNLRESIEKVIENVIYLHLLRLGFEVTVGILRAGEVDFVAENGGKRAYIQATYLLGSQETIKREFGNLASIPDNYSKLVVSMDPLGGDFHQYPGIRHINLREFLLIGDSMQITGV
jgi:ATPase